MIATSAETIAWILSLAALISALFVIFKGLSILVRISHDIVDLKDWVRKEMSQNGDKSLKELTDRVDAIERRMRDA